MATVDDFLIDFSKEEEGGGGGTRVPPGKYPVKIIKAAAMKSKDKQTPGVELLLLVTDGKKKGKKLTENLWATPKAYSRFRLLLEACGIKVPPKVNLVKIANAVKGKEIVVEVDDEEREGYRTRSRVTFEGFFNVDDVDEDELDEEETDEEEEDLEEEDEEEEEKPKAKKKSKAKKKPADEDEDEELDDLDLDDL